MQSNAKFLRYTWFVLVMVFLVILAGGVVRMTQSGMGCPDWPKCFGRWVPPTNAGQLPHDFEKYLKQQDIDHTFNAYHTWIEYINRLLGALLGVFIFIHFIWSFRKFRPGLRQASGGQSKSNKSIVILSFALLLAVGFQGWLGKKVVDDNLAVVKVTIHMLVALLIAAIPLLIIHKLNGKQKIESSALKMTTTIFLLILLVQVVLGTQVREQIDEISKPLKYTQRQTWIAQLDNLFVIHRSFSWFIVLCAGLLAWIGWPFSPLRKNILAILIMVVLAVGLGITMAWYSIPALAQPMHLLVASALTLTVFYLRLRVK